MTYDIWLETFQQKYTPEPNSGCWLWTATTDKSGYGQVRTPDHRTARAHRTAYELYVGPIPEGHQLRRQHRPHDQLPYHPGHLPRDHPPTPRGHPTMIEDTADTIAVLMAGALFTGALVVVVLGLL